MARYEKYKDSGIQWIGEVPEHWKNVPVSALFREFSDKGHPDFNVLSVYREYGVIEKDSRDDNHNVTSENTEGYKAIDIGDFVINKMKAWQGSMGVSDFKGIVSPAYITCRFRTTEHNRKFIHHLLRSQSYINHYNRLSDGVRVGQWDMHFEDFKRLRVFLPTRDEQDRIVSFIDSSLAEIDKAIAQQQRMIDLLNERKQIIIQNAVTKGLDPNVPMKDSGIDWVKAIPCGWSVLPLKSICGMGKGLQITKADLIEEGLPVVSYGQVHAKYNSRTHLSQDLIRYVPMSFAKGNESSIVHPKEFIVADTSEDFEGCGNMAYNDSQEDIYAGYHTVILNNVVFDEPKYLAYLFNSKDWRMQIRRLVNGVKVFSVTKGILKQTSIIKPSPAEQKEIVNFLDIEVAKIDTAISKSNRMITSLAERKRIIINDVVTGKIKVS